MEIPDDLTNSILKRTSGPACARARAYLPDLADGKLEAGSAGLLALHLDYCSGCRALDQRLRELSETFQGMALLEPDEGFTTAVMHATVKRRSASSRLRLKVWWGRQIRRPRFALEAAYIGTLLCVLVFGNPASMVGNATALVRPVTAKSPVVWNKSGAAAARVSRNISGVLADQADSVTSSLRKMREESTVMLSSAIRRGSKAVRDYYNKALRFLSELFSGRHV
jgi:anti-sigma factor RsiW